MEKLGCTDSDSKVSFYSRKNNTRSVFIEGFGNRFSEEGKLLIDRGNDLIEPKAWDVKNFASNAIILFNHDRDNPVGRAVKVEKQDDGLFLKVKMSDSDHPEIKRIRDLVKDGTLRAFSVGFNPREATEEEIDGRKVNVIKDAELLEVSIVSLPMAERSLFNVSAKHLAAVPYEVAQRACLGELKLLSDDGEHYSDEATEIIDSITKEEEPAPEPTPEPTPEPAAEPVSSQPTETATSPLIDQVKQTNILLSTLISEMRLMSAKLDRAEVVKEEEEEEPAPEPTEPTETEPEAETDDDKKLKQVDDVYAECDMILRKHGI